MAAAKVDPQSFGVVYSRHVGLVVVFLRRRTGSRELAGELTAETFAQAFVHRSSFNPNISGSSALPWLLGIAAREAAKARRRNRVEGRARAKLGLPTIQLDEQSYEEIEERVSRVPLDMQLREAMRGLSKPLARAVWLRVALDKPYREVASELGCSEGAARVRVARGIVQLGRAMGVR
ncbi:MAG: RNA polymerase sigma factor [Actinomycetota bacterium]